MRRLIFVFSFLALSSPGALPPDAQAYLAKLPQKKVTLDLVLAKAIESSDSFRAVLAAEPALAAPRLQARAPLDVRLYTKASHLEDRREPQNAFMPNNQITTAFAVGASTYFPTGTGLSAELGHGSTALRFPTIPGSDFFETRGTVTVTQNLWKDGFGYATRKGVEAGELSSQAQAMELQETLEDWTLGIVQVFYGAWLAQAQAKTALSNVDRRERLVKNTQLRVNRGTAETPDLLQVQNARLNAEVQKDQAAQMLGQRWRELRTAIKLPETLNNLDPIDVPIALDDPASSMLGLCGSSSKLNAAPKDSTTTRKADLQQKAAESLLARAKNVLAPSIELSAGVFSNGIDAARSPTFGEAFRRDHPGWSLGATVSLPLGQYAEEAAARVAFADQARSEAVASLARDQLQLDWVTHCLNLHRLKDARNRFETAFQNQTRRVKLENTRFGVGRGTTFAVVQAEDDATAAEMALLNAEAEFRMAAWRVRRLAQGFENYFKKGQAK